MKTVSSVVAILVCVSGAYAADKPNFSGDWKMNAAKSNYGQVPPPDTFTRHIEHKEPSITIVEEQSGPGTTPKSTRSMKTDGQVANVDINGAPVKLTATWEGAELLAISSIEAFDMKFKDRMSLSADGKELTSAVVVETAQGPFEVKIVFDKQ